MQIARFVCRILTGSFVFLLIATAPLSGEEGPAGGRLVVVLQNALPWPTASIPPAVPRALVFTFSDWTSGKPHLEAVAVRDAQSEAACSTVAFSQGQLEASMKFRVKDRGSDSEQGGEVSIRAGLEGTTGTGRYEGSYAGHSFAGDVRTALAFGHRFPDGQRSLRLWLPDLQQEVRSVMIYGNGAGGDDRDTVLGEQLLAFAAANRLGLIGTSQFGSSMRRGEGQMLLDALKTFARTTAHPELEHAPLVFTGHSNGGQMAHEFNAWMPSRVIAFGVWRGGFYESYTGLSPESLATPAVLSAGETDLERRVTAIRRLFDLNRPLGANWSLLVEEKMGHNRGNTLTLFLCAFQHFLEQRLPPDASSRKGSVQLRPVDPKRAWLADNSTWKDGITKIMPARGFKGDARRMSWLPDEDIAFVYRGLASYSNPLQLTRAGHPPAYRPDEPVVFECTQFGGAAWKSVEIYDGARRVGAVTREKPLVILQGPHTPGAHAAVAVGELPNGELRTSIPVDWVVWPAMKGHQVPE